MKVLLSTSPHVRHPVVLARDFENIGEVMYGFAPIGLLSLAGALRRDIGTSVDTILFDINAAIDEPGIRQGPNFYESLAQRLLEAAPDIIGFMTECDSYHHVLNVCRAVKAMRPHTHIVLGGPHASAVASETMREAPYIDAIVKGEGELSFSELVRQRIDGVKRPIAGAVQRYGSSWFDGGSAVLIDSLDDLPKLAYDLYRPGRLEEIFLEVGRGCPFACTFCSTAPYWGRRHRVKSPQRILDEIGAVSENYGATRIHFTHDLFTVDRHWVASLCDALVGAGAPVSWTCSARTDTVDEAMLVSMRKAGCSSIYFGLESGSATMLKSLRKSIPLDHSLRIIEFCSTIGIVPNAGFITGFPNETVDDLKATFEMFERVTRAKCKPTHIFAYCPFKGSDGYPTETELQANAHFLDIPLPIEIDEQNRTLVTGNPALFGAYFRARDHGWRTEESGMLEGIDEFTPLVESMRAPTLHLAANIGGLYQVYCRWIPWVAARNAARDVSNHRKYYGSPVLYCDFLLELATENGAEPSFIEFIVFSGQSSRAMATHAQGSALSMASFRSFEKPLVPATTLGTPISAKHVIATYRSNYDLSGYLTWQPHEAPPQPINAMHTYLWTVNNIGAVRLLRVAGHCPAIIAHLENNELSMAEIWLHSLNDEHAPWEDYDACQSWIENALMLGLLIPGEIKNVHAT